MPTIRCAHCGHTNASLRLTCDNCYLALKPPLQEQSLAASPTDIQKSRHILDDLADFIFYAGSYSGDLRIDIVGFLADLQTMKPELPELTLPEGFLSPKLPRLENPMLTFDVPDLPELDLSIVLSYLANLNTPQLDYTRALDFLAALQLPQIDLRALGELLPHINLSTVNLPALAELLPRIDLSTVDLPALGDLLSNIDLSAIDPAALGDLLSNIDLSAVDLSALADLLAGVDWSALAEGLSDIDLSALFELLEGIDLS